VGLASDDSGSWDSVGASVDSVEETSDGASAVTTTTTTPVTAVAAATGGANGAHGAKAQEAAVKAEAEGAKRKGPSSLVKRVVTAVVLGAFASYFIVSGGRPFAFFIAFIVWQCSLEYIQLMTSKKVVNKGKAPPAVLRRTMTTLCVGMIAAAQNGIRTGVFEAASFCLLVMLLWKRSTMKKRKKKKVRFSELTMLVFGLFYCGYLPTFWIRLRGVSLVPPVPPPDFIAGLLNWLQVEWTVGLLATFIVAANIVAADTGAFIGGKLMGSTPLISISPNKTVEGAAWGFAASLGVTLLFNNWLKFPGNLGVAIAFAVVVYAASLFGDLIESSMKRAAGKKDSGQLLPGHGGLLDRFDSYLFTGVLAYAVVYWWFYWCGTPLSQLIITPPR